MKRLIPLLFLAACADSPYLSDDHTRHGEFHVATVNGRWVAWWPGTALAPDKLGMKPLMIQAVEDVSGCQVVAAEYSVGFYLETETRCPS